MSLSSVATDGSARRYDEISATIETKGYSSPQSRTASYVCKRDYVHVFLSLTCIELGPFKACIDRCIDDISWVFNFWHVAEVFWTYTSRIYFGNKIAKYQRSQWLV